MSLREIVRGFFDGNPPWEYVDGERQYMIGHLLVTELIVREDLKTAILEEARSRGWNGNLWGHPLIVAFDAVCF